MCVKKTLDMKWNIKCEIESSRVVDVQGRGQSFSREVRNQLRVEPLLLYVLCLTARIVVAAAIYRHDGRYRV